MQINELSLDERNAIEKAFASAIIEIYQADPDHYVDNEQTIISMMNNIAKQSKNAVQTLAEFGQAVQEFGNLVQTGVNFTINEEPTIEDLV